MIAILNQIKSILETASGKHIFIGFDALPVRDKGEIFNVLTTGKYEAMTPIYNATSAYMPIKSEAILTVLAPMNTPSEQLYNYYYSNFDSAINDLCGLCNRLKSIEIAPDVKLKRLALKAVLDISSMKLITEQEVEND